MSTTGVQTSGRRRAARPAAILLGAIALLLIAASSAYADRNFSARYTANQPGDITIIGNTVLTCNTAVANCVNAQDGGNFDNNDFSMVRVDVDGVDPSNTSSRATLSTPAGATVLFAGLYWFGSAASDSSVKLQSPGQTGYTTLASDITPDTSGAFYSSFKDVTSIVSAAGDGVYTVADITADTGVNEDAGWALVVAYGDARSRRATLRSSTAWSTVSSGANPPERSPSTASPLHRRAASTPRSAS